MQQDLEKQISKLWIFRFIFYLNYYRALKSMYDASNLSEEMARHFDHLKDDLREIYEN